MLSVGVARPGKRSGPGNPNPHVRTVSRCPIAPREPTAGSERFELLAACRRERFFGGKSPCRIRKVLENKGFFIPLRQAAR